MLLPTGLLVGLRQIASFHCYQYNRDKGQCTKQGNHRSWSWASANQIPLLLLFSDVCSLFKRSYRYFSSEFTVGLNSQYVIWGSGCFFKIVGLFHTVFSYGSANLKKLRTFINFFWRLGMKGIMLLFSSTAVHNSEGDTQCASQL